MEWRHWLTQLGRPLRIRKNRDLCTRRVESSGCREANKALLHDEASVGSRPRRQGDRVLSITVHKSQATCSTARRCVIGSVRRRLRLAVGPAYVRWLRFPAHSWDAATRKPRKLPRYIRRVPVAARRPAAPGVLTQLPPRMTRCEAPAAPGGSADGDDA